MSGLFGISEDFLEKYQSLDQRLIKNRTSTFFFQAKSDDMAPLIMKDDILVVDRSLTLYQRRIVVLALDGELICRRYIPHPTHLLLQTENPRVADITVTPEQEHEVWGVVTAIAREII